MKAHHFFMIAVIKFSVGKDTVNVEDDEFYVFNYFSEAHEIPARKISCICTTPTGFFSSTTTSDVILCFSMICSASAANIFFEIVMHFYVMMVAIGVWRSEE